MVGEPESEQSHWAWGGGCDPRIILEGPKSLCAKLSWDQSISVWLSVSKAGQDYANACPGAPGLLPPAVWTEASKGNGQFNSRVVQHTQRPSVVIKCGRCGPTNGVGCLGCNVDENGRTQARVGGRAAIQ